MLGTVVITQDSEVLGSVDEYMGSVLLGDKSMVVAMKAPVVMDSTLKVTTMSGSVVYAKNTLHRQLT